MLESSSTSIVMTTAPALPKPNFRLLMPYVYKNCVIVEVVPAGPPPVSAMI